MNLKSPTKLKVFEDITALKESASWKSAKSDGTQIVFTNGCFDILHIGHVDYLEKAALKANFLIVALNSDNSVSRLKGEDRPINSWLNRAKMLAALAFVDAVVQFEEDTPKSIIETLSPDVLVKGSDYAISDIVGGDFVIENGGRVETIDFVHDISTSKILEILKK